MVIIIEAIMMISQVVLHGRASQTIMELITDKTAIMMGYIEDFTIMLHHWYQQVNVADVFAVDRDGDKVYLFTLEGDTKGDLLTIYEQIKTEAMGRIASLVGPIDEDEDLSYPNPEDMHSDDMDDLPW